MMKTEDHKGLTHISKNWLMKISLTLPFLGVLEYHFQAQILSQRNCTQDILSPTEVIKHNIVRS